MLRKPSIVVVAFVVLLANLAQAQRRPGGASPGTRVPIDRSAQLEIVITYPNSHPADAERFMVELMGSGGSLNARTYSGSEGRASFTVPPGTYTVRITGSTIKDTTSEPFSIYGGEMMHHETVAVEMKETATPTSPGGMVSATQLNVPEKARKEYDKGMESLKARDYKKAEGHFDKAIKEYPNFDWAYNSLGVARMHLDNREGAREAFSKAIEIEPKNAHAQRNLGRLLVTEQKWAEAEPALRNSLTTQPQDPDGLTLLAMAELNLGKVDQALSDARRVHTGAKHDCTFSHLIAARAYEAKKMSEQAAAEYQTYLQESPNDADAEIAKQGLARLQKANEAASQ